MKLTTKEIMEIIPHRHPFLLIDTIEELGAGCEGNEERNVLPIMNRILQDTFPQEPVMPGF
mgnify:CR=1 FL=1